MARLELSDGHLEYWETGAGPPLVYIHGSGTPGRLFFEEIGTELGAECRFIAYNRRGYTESSASPGDWAAHTPDLVRLIETLGAAPATIAGFSGGAIVALDLALQRPDLVSSLVLLDPAHNIRKLVTPNFIRHFATAKLLRRRRGDRAGAAHWMRYVSSYSTGGSAWDKAPPERRDRVLAEAGGLFADAQSGGGEHVDEARLREIACPVTLVSCALSPPFLQKSSKRLRELLPQARSITLDHAGHHITLDAREDLLRILREAVREQTSAGDRPPQQATT